MCTCIFGWCRNLGLVPRPQGCLESGIYTGIIYSHGRNSRSCTKRHTMSHAHNYDALMYAVDLSKGRHNLNLVPRLLGESGNKTIATVPTPLSTARLLPSASRCTSYICSFMVELARRKQQKNKYCHQKLIWLNWTSRTTCDVTPMWWHMPICQPFPPTSLALDMRVGLGIRLPYCAG